MGIVRFTPRFPYTLYVVATLIAFLGCIAAYSMQTDILPEIRIPVVTVTWNYSGLSAPEMEQRVMPYSQYVISANVNGIRNIEAQTLAGLSVQKVYFQQDVNLDLAISQIVAATNTIRALMPPGIQPPALLLAAANAGVALAAQALKLILIVYRGWVSEATVRRCGTLEVCATRPNTRVLACQHKVHQAMASRADKDAADKNSYSTVISSSRSRRRPSTQEAFDRPNLS
jgi:hypothetical protein